MFKNICPVLLIAEAAAAAAAGMKYMITTAGYAWTDYKNKHRFQGNENNHIF
jgi:opacity protein-like surface antigen